LLWNKKSGNVEFGIPYKNVAMLENSEHANEGDDNYGMCLQMQQQMPDRETLLHHKNSCSDRSAGNRAVQVSA
jgi:hypothetical protein